MGVVTMHERDQKIIETLKAIKVQYREALTMPYQKQNRLILKYIQLLCGQHEELAEVVEACSKVLAWYPGEEFPHDTTLVEEAVKLVKWPLRAVFPHGPFEEDILCFKLFDWLIEDQFKAIKGLQLERSESLMIERLWLGVHNTLVENPNFKGANPFYKRNYREMGHAKKLSLELLDEDYNGTISYFEEEV